MLTRVITLIIGPPILIWAFLARFIREMANAVKYAWWEASAEFHSMRRAWRAKSMNQEDWKK